MLSAIKTLWDLLTEMIEKRWLRYLAAALLPVFGILIGVQALLGISVHTVSGTIRSVEIKRDTQTGDYQEHLIALDGGTTHYAVEVNYFSPTLSQDALSAGEHVQLWYDQVPLFDPDVLALQITDANGTSTKYVTNAYSDPVGTRKGSLITAGVFILLGLLSLAAGIWLPARRDSGEEGKSGEGAQRSAAKPSYGAMVLGPRQPPDGDGR